MFLTRAAVRNPILVLMVCIAAVVLSQIAVTRLPLDLFPSITVPAVSVSTGYSGASPEDVERTVTYVIESAITRVPGVQQIQSTSRRGSSFVQVWFDWDKDINVALVEVIQNVQRVAGALPDGAGQPSVLKFDIANTPVAQVVLSVPGLDARQLYQLATDTIEPQLERLPGVSTAFVSGGIARQFNINVDPKRLAATGLALQDVDTAVRRYNALLPSGSLRNPQIDFQLKVPILLQSVDDIRRVVISTRNGVPVHVGDIALVEDATADRTQIVKVNGLPGVTLSVVRQPGANIVAVVDSLRAELPHLAGIPQGTDMRISFDQSRYVRSAITSLTHEALIGALLVFAVILLFLPNLWNLFIIGIGLPLSVATSLILLYFTGQTLNVFTLGGLTLALGRLADDAIVVRENITRHLGRPGISVRQAVLDATHEVGTAVFASTATTVAVFFPVVFLFGIARRLFVPMALTIVFAMSASYIVSMTVDPTLSMRVLRARKHGEDEEEPGTALGRFMARLERSSNRLHGRLDAGYQRVLERALRRRWWVVAGMATLFAVSLFAMRFVGSEFFPATDESQFSVGVQLPQGTAVQVTSEAAGQVEGVVRQIVQPRYITTITTTAGSGGGPFGGGGPNFGQVNVRLVPPSQRDASTDELAARVRRGLDGKLPGAQFFVSIGGIQRNIVNIGAGAPIDVQILGYDQTIAQQLAAQVAAAVAQTPGTADVRISPRGQYPAFTVRIDKDKAALLGLSPAAVASAITMAISGNAGTASRLIDPISGAQYGIVTRLMTQYRTDPEDLADVPLITLADTPADGAPSPTGRTPILLRDIARVSLSSEPLQISRKNQQRVVDVTANVVNRPLGAVSAEVGQAMERISWPVGFTYHLAGQTEQQTSAFGSLGLASALALMLVYMIMASQFGSLVDPFVIMFTVPLGLIGVVWTLLLTHVTLSIMSFMGIITMVGIVVSNGILLVDYANKLQVTGLTALAAIVQAGRTRLRPILMTALATILGMMPMALGLGEGSETNMPLARSVIGGLAVSTFLTLFLIPILYTLFERRGHRVGATE
ncbi:MAG TPA: efflux RND transporter permease subunit [bacterium]